MSRTYYALEREDGLLYNCSLARRPGAVRLIGHPAGMTPHRRCAGTCGTGCAPGGPYHPVPHEALIQAQTTARARRAAVDAEMRLMAEERLRARGALP